MSREKSAQVSLLEELFDFGLYKRSQGRIARQVTCAALGLIVAVAAWRLSSYLQESGRMYQFGIPMVVLAVGWWLCYRVVNIRKFADFLIGVEGEMAKVSWPSRTELIRSSIVVILTIFVLAFLLFAYDFLWNWLLAALGVIDR
ncbi:MAG: preprotein translocase subunit SecE [Planctomycetales bacterium]|nr:preprotein translocase subunit SecE [Planctomycetales bacterium]